MRRIFTRLLVTLLYRGDNISVFQYSTCKKLRQSVLNENGTWSPLKPASSADVNCLNFEELAEQQR